MAFDVSSRSARAGVRHCLKKINEKNKQAGMQGRRKRGRKERGREEKGVI